MEDREVIAFDKKGDKFARLDLHSLYYLQTEKDWIMKLLNRAPDLDGIVITINWDTKEIICVRKSL